MCLFKILAPTGSSARLCRKDLTLISGPMKLPAPYPPTMVALSFESFFCFLGGYHIVVAKEGYQPIPPIEFQKSDSLPSFHLIAVPFVRS